MVVLRRVVDPVAPETDANSEALHQLGGRRKALKAFVQSHRRRVTLVPSRDVIFAVLGDPAGKPELAWLADGSEYHLRDLVRARGLSKTATRAGYKSHHA